MTSAALSAAKPAGAALDALVIGLYAGTDGPVAADPSFADLVAGLVLAGATGRVGEVVVIPAPDEYRTDRIVSAGLGKEAELTPNRIRQAAGVTARALAGHATVGSTLSGLNIGAAAEGHLLGAYVFDTYKEPKKAPVKKFTLFVDSATAANKSVLRRAVIGAEAVGMARDLVNTAPNDLPPAVFAVRATAAAKEAGLSVTVLDEKALAKAGYGGILGVGAGSSRPPRLLQISYTPTVKPKASVALIGKGITFDSGGLSIKPAAGMDHMTSDMSGAAAVVATVIAAAALKLRVAVTAFAALAENLPSGTSYRPGDVLTHFGGKTVHVLNTDAEGRLVLADAIVRAAQDNPDYLIETSTLTGAQVVALGNRTMGVMGTEDFRDRIALLAREVGDGGWAMPMPEELRDGLDSSVADIANVAGDRAGGMLVAAHYLKEFVPDGLTWAHLDVAGPAFNTGKPYGYTSSGGTGIPVRTLLAVLEDIAGS